LSKDLHDDGSKSASSRKDANSPSTGWLKTVGISMSGRGPTGRAACKMAEAAIRHIFFPDRMNLHEGNEYNYY